MSIEMTARRSRRAMLAAAAGAALATASAALEVPAEVRAGSDGDVVLGQTNTAGTTTLVENTTTTEPALKGRGTTGDGP